MSKYEVIKLHSICQFWQELLPLKGHNDDLQRKGNNVALPCAGLSDAGFDRALHNKSHSTLPQSQKFSITEDTIKNKQGLN